MANRPLLYKCSNYQDCLTGYRGEDVEIFPGMAMVCPECGGALHPIPKPTPAYVAHLINLVIVATIAGAVWLAWPTISSFWNKPEPQKPAPALKK